MLIQVQYSKSILLEIYSEQEPRQCFSLLIEKNKQTKKPTEEAKGTILDFSQETIRVLWMLSYDLPTACSTKCCCFNIISI